nr:DUF885 family protein [uncultured Sphingomonas sp.]
MLIAFPAAARTRTTSTAIPNLLTRQFEERLTLNPEMATFFGIDTGERASLRSRFSESSLSGLDRARRTTAKHLRELQAMPDTDLSDEHRLEREVSLFDLEAQHALNSFAYHAGSGPYGPTPLESAYQNSTLLLRDFHPVTSRDDAEAYLTRLALIPGLIDGESAQITRNAAAGAIAPRVIVAQLIAILTAARDADPAKDGLVTAIETKASALKLAGYGARAQTIVADGIRPALTRQIAALQAVLPRGADGAKAGVGVGRLPNGAAYYEACLRMHTTTDMTADAIHAFGVAQVATLSTQIDALLKSQGMASGSIKQRTSALAVTSDQAFPDTEEGRAAIIAYLNDRLDRVKKKLPEAFGQLPKNGYEIRRMAREMEDGNPFGVAYPGAADGSRPGVFFINLQSISDWPRYTLPTLAFHEAAPGHLFDIALQLEAGELPLYRRTWFFNGFREGWGLYAEQVADELGMYDDDPAGKIGYLQSHLFRAARLVVDTGIHSRGWDRERAIDYLTEHSSMTRDGAAKEVDRYIVMPAQACSYMIGHTTFTRLRDEASKRPGFDLRAFHDFVLQGGAMPLTVLERRLKSWPSA